MNFRIKISKKQWIRLAIFAGLIAVAALFDIYSGEKGIEISVFETGKPDASDTRGNVQLFSQSVDMGGKVQVAKTVVRKNHERSHDRLIQNYHNLRNYQVLKAEVQTQITPIFLAYHFLPFRNFYFSSPDDDYPTA